MDKNSVEYKELMQKIDELTRDIFALADSDTDAAKVGDDLFSIRRTRGAEAKRNREEAEAEAKKAKAAEECKEKLIDLISTYIVEVNPASGGRARRTLIENYANLTIKMMKDPESALYKVEAPKETAEPTKSNMNAAVEQTVGILRDAFNATPKVDEAMLRAWVRSL